VPDQPLPSPRPRIGSLLPLLALPVAFLAGFSCSGGQDGFSYQGPPPNIVLFLADDLGWSDLGYRGGEMKTPRLDDLAKKGVVLDRFYVFPSCSPTRAAILTGRSPMRLGMLYGPLRPWLTTGVPPEERLLPEDLKEADYETAIVGKWHLGHASRSLWPQARGFDHFYGCLTGMIDYYQHTGRGGLDWQRDGTSLHEKGYSTDLFAKEAVRIIEDHDPGKPLFLYLPFNAPHAPLEAPAALEAKYRGIKDPRRRRYCAMVDSMDQAVGKVLDALDRKGMTKDTLVLFVSDNGASPQDGGRNAPLRGGKLSTLEGGIHVPAMVWWPGHLEGGRNSGQVMTAMDLLPTLAGAAGVQPRAAGPLDGKNLLGALLSGRVESREDLFFAISDPAFYSYAVFHGEWKLVRRIRKNDGQTFNALFRIEEDPNESRDLSRQHPDLVKDLGARIEAWRATYPPGGFEFNPRPPAAWKAPNDWAAAASK